MQFDPSARIKRDIGKMLRAFSKGRKIRYLFYRETIYRRYSCCISPLSKIADDVAFPHPVGIVIGEGAIVHEGCTIYQNVTLGRSDKDIASYPTLGPGCTIYAGATVIGGVTLQPDTTVAAHAVVTKSNSRKGDVLIGIPARSKFDMVSRKV